MATKDSYQLPARVKVEGIDPAVASINDLGKRRDILLQLAERATQEARAIDGEINAKIEEFNKQLRVLRAEQLP